MRQIYNVKPDQIAQKLVEDKRRFDSYILSATPEIADRLGRAAIQYNGVNPSIVASMVLSGNQEALPMLSEFVAKQSYPMGIAPSTKREGGFSPQERGARYQRALDKAAQTPDIKTPVAATSRTTVKEPNKNTSFLDKVNHYTKLTTAFDWVAPDLVQEAMSTVSDFGYSQVKSLSTGFGAGLSYLPQIVINEIAAAANYGALGESVTAQKKGNLFDQFVKGPLYEETYLGQLLGQSAKAAVSKEKVTSKEVMGAGFGPGGLVVQAQQKAVSEYRPMIGTGENKHAFTMGRFGAQQLADLNIIEEGSAAYSVVSGVIDFAMAVRTDPSFGKPLNQPFGSAGKAATAITETDAVRVAAGIAKGRRPTVLPTRWNEWKDTVEAVKILEPFVQESNPAQVWRNLKRKAILSADEIASAKNHGEVVAAMDNAVNNIEPAYNIRNLPAGKFSSASDAGYVIKQNAQRYTNMFEMLPSSTFIPNSDPQEAATRMDDLMGYLGFDIEKRNTWINKLIETHKDGTSKSFFNYLSSWEKEVLADALEKNLVPKSEIPALTRWKKSTMNQVTRFTLQDVHDGVPPAWMEAGGYGPLRNTQLLQDGAYVIDPSELQDVSKKLGAWYKFEQEALNTPQPAKSLYKAGFKTKDVTSDGYNFFITKLWKPMTVAAIRYLAKVLPNEHMRVLLNGTFEHPAHYMAAIADGRWTTKIGVDGKYVADVFGEPLNKTIFLQELDNQVIETKAVIERIRKLNADGKFEEAIELELLYDAEISDLDNILAQQERTSRLLEDDIPGLQDALIGRVPGEARRKISGYYADGTASKLGNTSIVSRNIAKESKNWVKGIIQEVADLNRNPHIRRIANGGLFDGDTLVIDGVTSSWKTHKAEGRFIGSDDAIATWLFNGSGRKYFETYFKNYAGIPEGYEWDSIKNANEFVRTLNNEVKSIAGTNKVILEAIVSGSHEGEAAFEILKTRETKGKESFLNYVSDVFIKDKSAPTEIRYRGNVYAGVEQPGTKVGEVYDFVLDYFFKNMYGRSSDKLSRSPAYRAAYWGRVEEVAHLASPDAAKELLKNIEAANIPRMQKDRVRTLLEISNGGTDLELINKSASIYGVNYVRDLLFDASKRSAFGAQHKYMFPFFEAYREEASTWFKLLVEKPVNGHKIDVVMRQLKEIEDPTIDDDSYSKNNSFIYRDAATGEDRVAVIGSGWLGTLFSQVPVGNFSLPTGSMSMFSNFLPGIGVAPAWAAQYFTPKGKDWKFVNDALFPYGRPEESSNAPIGGLLEGSLPRPVWFKRVSPYISDVVKKTPIVGNNFGELVASIFDSLGGDPKEDSVWQAYNLKTLQSLASTRPIPSTQKQMEKLLSDAEDATNKLYFIRGLGNFILPGTPVTTFMVKTKQGAVETGVLADIRRQYQADAKKVGESADEADMKFIDIWGESTWATFGSIRRSKKYDGIIMSEEFEDWFSDKKNQKLIKTYPAIASYFGPRVEPEKFGRSEQSVYNRFVGRGVIAPQTNEELIAQAQTNVAYTIFDSVKNQMSLQQQSSKQGQDVLAATKEVISKYLPKWDAALGSAVSKAKREEQISQLREIIQEPAVKNTDIGKMVIGYLDLRDSEIEKLKKSGIKGWQKGNASLPLRTKLTAFGDGLSKIVPEFGSLWENVLSKEFELPVTEEQ